MQYDAEQLAFELSTGSKVEFLAFNGYQNVIFSLIKELTMI